MKRKSLKKGLVMALMTTMLVSSVFTVEAASGGSSGSSGTSAKEEKTQEASQNAAANELADAFDTDVAFEDVTVVSAGAAVTVAGKSVKPTIAGAFVVKSLQGTAVITPLADIRESLQLKAGQTPYVMAFDTDAKKSPLAMKCIDAAISAQGGSFVTAVSVDLCAKENGRLISLSNGSAAMAVGLPKSADSTKSYYVICVQPGGAISVLQDQDNNPNTVTFEIKAGLGTYALVAK